MRIIVVGASGAVGGPTVEALSGRHDVIRAGRTSGDLQVDLEDPASIRALYEQAGKVDAVVSAMGSVHFGPIAGMTSEQFMTGMQRKLLPQVNLVLE